MTTLDVVVPTHNEEHTLERCIEQLHACLRGLPFATRVTIADNASTDATVAVAQRLAAAYSDVRLLTVPAKGRGLALRTAWLASDADVVAYVDVDLSTNLNALLPLVAPLVSGHSDVAIGTRLASGSRVLRGSKREFVSRSYNLVLKATLGTGFSDAQCGFKAVRADTARWLVPLIEDDSWFFDTELLVLAERAGLRIHEVPVDWVDDPDTRVDIIDTARDDLRGIARLGWNLARHRIPLMDRRPWPPTGTSSLATQIARFAVVGGFSTLAYAALYLLLRNGMSAGSANVFALVLTTILNTSANRWWTFGVRGRQRVVRHQLQGLSVFAVGLVVTSTALAMAPHFGLTSRLDELIVLTAGNLVVTVGRFVALRYWMLGRRPSPSATRTGRRPAAPQPATSAPLVADALTVEDASGSRGPS